MPRRRHKRSAWRRTIFIAPITRLWRSRSLSSREIENGGRLAFSIGPFSRSATESWRGIWKRGLPRTWLRATTQMSTRLAGNSCASWAAVAG